MRESANPPPLSPPAELGPEAAEEGRAVAELHVAGEDEAEIQGLVDVDLGEEEESTI